mmetsp:Transcript_15998/g.27540  ORF Transcript_15998/g.27540 Transcript_15998/m.27540 type:complete len:255 (+) Transcript_15998:426-1190(+)
MCECVSLSPARKSSMLAICWWSMLGRLMRNSVYTCVKKSSNTGDGRAATTPVLIVMGRRSSASMARSTLASPRTLVALPPASASPEAEPRTRSGSGWWWGWGWVRAREGRTKLWYQKPSGTAEKGLWPKTISAGRTCSSGSCSCFVVSARAGKTPSACSCCRRSGEAGSESESEPEGRRVGRKWQRAGRCRKHMSASNHMKGVAEARRLRRTNSRDGWYMNAPWPASSFTRRPISARWPAVMVSNPIRVSMSQA